MARSPTAPCPCASGRSYKRCCLRYHQGAIAPSPEALMRSRYSAYAVGAVDYLIATTDPDGPQHRADREVWAEEIAEFCHGTRFIRLRIRSVSEAEVDFEVELSRDGKDASFGERSRFTRIGDRWLYHSGQLDSEAH